MNMDEAFWILGARAKRGKSCVTYIVCLRSALLTTRWRQHVSDSYKYHSPLSAVCIFCSVAADPTRPPTAPPPAPPIMPIAKAPD